MYQEGGEGDNDRSLLGSCVTLTPLLVHSGSCLYIHAKGTQVSPFSVGVTAHRSDRNQVSKLTLVDEQC